jgi:hypothetical protein
VAGDNYVTKLIAAGKTRSFLSNWRVTDERRNKIESDTKEIADTFTDCVVVTLCVSGCFGEQLIPDAAVVGLVMKLLTPLLKRMFSSSPDDLGITVEQGVLEYPSHAYHVSLPRL